MTEKKKVPPLKKKGKVPPADSLAAAVNWSKIADMDKSEPESEPKQDATDDQLVKLTS